MLNDNVASVLSVFTKLITRLEKIKVRLDEKAEAALSRIDKEQAKVDAAVAEMNAADKAIDKLRKFVEE